MRRNWFKVFGIKHCHDWQRICSDNFLEGNYKPGKSDLYFQILTNLMIKMETPNYAIQSNDVETGNNINLPMEQNITRKEHVGNAVVNNFKSPRRSSRLTRNNDDMSNTNMPNTKLKQIYKTSAGPVFLSDDEINRKNIPSSSKRLNRCLSRSNEKPSSSSSNDVANVESDKCPLLVYISSKTRNDKDFEIACSVPECITNTKKEVGDICFYAPSKERYNEWSEILGVQLTVTSLVCEKHFRSQDILQNELLLNGFHKKLKALGPNAMPMPMNKLPELSTCKDRLRSPVENEAAEQSSSEEKNNVKDNTDNTSMTIDLTIDDSSNSSFSVTLEPID